MSPNIIDTVNRALLDHSPKIDHRYEEVECTCGWIEPDVRGSYYSGPKDRARDWPDHQRRAVRTVLKAVLR